MKNLKIVKMIVVLLVALVVMSISTNVFAMNLLENPTEGDGNTVLDPDIFEEYPEGDDDEKEPTPSTPSTPSTPTEEEKLPQTGDASDYAIFLLIGLFTVVSIYAYRKVKDYNKI